MSYNPFYDNVLKHSILVINGEPLSHHLLRRQAKNVYAKKTSLMAPFKAASKQKYKDGLEKTRQLEKLAREAGLKWKVIYKAMCNGTLDRLINYTPEAT